MENVFKEAYNALLVTNTEDGGDRTWNGGRFGWDQGVWWSARLFSQRKIPETATKVEKGVIRKRAKKFLLVDGVLHYKQSVKGGEQRLRQVRVNNLHCHGGAKLLDDNALCNNVLFILHVRLSETEWPRQEYWKPAMTIGLEAAILNETGPLTRLQHVTTGGAFITTLRNG